LERTRDKLGTKDIALRDLRRTAGTYMSRYGVPKDRERILKPRRDAQRQHHEEFL
jgi:hypothetical protein